MANYDGSQVGVPFIRVNQLNVTYPDGAGGVPTAQIFQTEAVTLEDGTSRTLRQLDTITVALTFSNDVVVPLVDPETGAPLGASMSTNQIFAGVLAMVRQAQLAHNS